MKEKIKFLFRHWDTRIIFGISFMLDAALFSSIQIYGNDHPVFIYLAFVIINTGWIICITNAIKEWKERKND